MKRLPALSAIGLAAVVLIGGAQPPADGEARAVRGVLDAYLDSAMFPNHTPIEPAWFAGDIEAFWSGGQHLRGREAVVAALTEGVRELAAEFATFKITPADVHLHRAGDLAWIACRLDFAGQLAGDGGPFSRTVGSTFVFEKRAGRWQMVHEHSSRLPPFKP